MSTDRTEALLKVGAAKDFWNTHAAEKLNIKSLNMNDGPHGVRGTQSADIIVTKNNPATCFPTSSAMAATFNPELIHEVGEAIGKEAKDHGIHVLLGPGINLKRTPLGGRNFEYYSEDSCLTGEIASRFVEGIQKQGVAACLKHFVMNEQEVERMTINCLVDEKTLFDVYIRPFRYVIQKAAPMMIMSSYNMVNGSKVTESKYLLRDVLRGRLRYDGCIVSDWGAVEHPVEGLIAGVDFDMPYMGGYQIDEIWKAVEGGKIPEVLLEERYEHVRKMQDKLDFAPPAEPVDYGAHYELAYRVACEAMVLLRNRTGKLPLSADSEPIGILGDFFVNTRFQGAGSSKVTPFKQMSFKEALEQNYPDISYDYLDITGMDPNKEAGLSKIKEFAKDHKTLFLFTGLQEMDESEGIDRNSMALSGKENRLITAVIKSNPDVIVILNNGTAVSFDKIEEADTLLEAWLGGEAAGDAFWDIVFGKTNPSGKLSETFPRKDTDLPMGAAFKMNETDVVYSEGILNGYKYYDYLDKEVNFPFGYGLSYTTFVMDNFQVLEKEGIFEISLRITNTGDREGKEVVQLYLGQAQRDMDRILPKRQLCQFEKVSLKPGEGKEIVFTLHLQNFETYHTAIHDYCIEAGRYTLSVGTSSREIVWEKNVEVKEEATTLRKELFMLDEHSLCKEFYQNSITHELFAATFEYLNQEDLFEIILDMPLELIARLFPKLIAKETIENFLAGVEKLKQQTE